MHGWEKTIVPFRAFTTLVCVVHATSCVCICVCMCVCVCVCVYICMCVCTVCVCDGVLVIFEFRT